MCVSQYTAPHFIAPDARVLIVDDINVNLKMTEDLLQPYKFKIDLCRSGEEAIEAVKKCPYDIIFMDHLMPEMNGIEAMAKIREIEGKDLKSLPIIALSADENREETFFLNNGFNSFLSKPINKSLLNDILEKWIPKEKQNITQGITKDNEDAQYNVFDAEIPDVNIEKGIRLTGGTVKNYKKILKLYYTEGLKKLSQLKTSLENKNIDTYTALAHGIKSSSNAIGAEKLSNDAKKLEDAGSINDLNYIQSNNENFMKDFNCLLENINKVIKEPVSVSAYDPKKLLITLAQLKIAVDDLDAAAINKEAAALNEYINIEEIGDSIRSIINNKMTGDYDEVISAIGICTGILTRSMESALPSLPSSK